MSGTKRKIPMQKIEKRESRAVAFSKRRKGLFGKASEFCLLSGSRIAILASKPNASFYSFGHSSVDSVVSAFLENQQLPKDDHTRLGFWWEDEKLLESEDLDELRDAIESMSRLMNELNELKKKKKKKQEEGILIISDNALPEDIQELDIYQTIDFETESESLSMNDVTKNQDLCENGEALVMYRDSDQDHSYKETEIVFENKIDESLVMNLKVDDESMMNMSQSPTCDWDEDTLNELETPLL